MTATNLSGRRAARRRATVTILVVEDEPLLRFALASEIAAAGFHVLEAANTDEAESVLATGAPIDLLITDIQMPGPRDGVALAETVRAIRPRAKIIVASGRPPPMGIDALADAFFAKPYDLDGVVRRVSSMVGTRENA